jgi:uncharacterized protein (TIGR00661 family)
MKIFYAVQATGNGHISRAMELVPILQNYGRVDVFLSGSNSHLAADLPIRFRSKGVSLFYNNSGGMNYLKTAARFNPVRMLRDAMQLPVEQYDMVVNDFESITALACALKKIPSVNFGHQASFRSANAPRPAKKDRMGEWVLNNYARASHYIGLHFKRYDDFIFPPIIKKEILQAEPADKNYITVYLPSCSDEKLLTQLSQWKSLRFEIFSGSVKQPQQLNNISLLPVDKNRFNHSLINCSGIITGAGFETPAEALYLGKKLLAIPIRGQYEQQCNAVALKQLGVKIIHAVDGNFRNHIIDWLSDSRRVELPLVHSAESIVAHLVATYPSQKTWQSPALEQVSTVC